MIAATWHDLVTANAAIALLTLTLVVVGLRYVAKGGGGAALHILTEANTVLVNRVAVLEAKEKEHAAKEAQHLILIAELQARTDVAVQLQPIVTWTADHEKRDQERFEKTLMVLERIAERLGPDGDTTTT